MHRATTGELIIPNFTEFTKQLEAVYHETKDVRGGKNAAYIPQLAKMNSGKAITFAF